MSKGFSRGLTQRVVGWGVAPLRKMFGGFPIEVVKPSTYTKGFKIWEKNSRRTFKKDALQRNINCN